MANHRGGTPQDTVEAALEGLGVEGCKALIEDDEVGLLEQGSGYIEPAAFPVGELPAGLADH